MRSTTAYEPDSRLTGPPANMELETWPLRDDKRMATVIIVLGVLVATGIGLLTASVIVGIVSAALLAVSLWRVWVPVQFEFSPKGIIQTALARRYKISWSDVKRREIRSNGVLLFFDTNRAPLFTLRGLYIRWVGRRDELIGIVDYYLGPRAHD